MYSVLRSAEAPSNHNTQHTAEKAAYEKPSSVYDNNEEIEYQVNGSSSNLLDRQHSKLPIRRISIVFNCTKM